MSDSRAATRRLKVGSDGKCFYCRRAFGGPTNGWTIMTLDHQVPRARGGTRNGPNGVLSCAGCNQAKADMMGEEYRYFLKTGQLHADYIAWLTEKAIRMAKARGIHVGTVDRGTDIWQETVPRILTVEERAALANFEQKLITGMMDAQDEMARKLRARHNV